jgi:hypothetical protein
MVERARSMLADTCAMQHAQVGREKDTTREGEGTRGSVGERDRGRARGERARRGEKEGESERASNRKGESVERLV